MRSLGLALSFRGPVVAIVPVSQRENRNGRDREEDPRQATELRAAQDRQDDAQRIQMNSPPDDLRVDDVILNGPEHQRKSRTATACPSEWNAAKPVATTPIVRVRPGE